MTVSPEFTCVCHKWALILYPGGHSDSTDGMISVYLACKLSSKVAVKYDIIIRHSSGEISTSAHPMTMLSLWSKKKVGVGMIMYDATYLEVLHRAFFIIEHCKSKFESDWSLGTSVITIRKLTLVKICISCFSRPMVLMLHST